LIAGKMLQTNFSQLIEIQRFNLKNSTKIQPEKKDHLAFFFADNKELKSTHVKE